MFGEINFKPPAARAFAFVCGLLASLPASANPQGPLVVSGAAGFANPNPQTLEVTNAPGAVINWQGFNIGVGETTRFIQQNAASAVLNRVTASTPSEILGALQSNGQVFLINPAGILIGRDATVDTAGLVMSTLDIKDADFTAGRFKFEGSDNSGVITNHGYIKSAPGGEVVLIAPKIVNAPEAGNDKSGLIETPNGELILAAGHALTISSLDDPNISFEVKAPDGEVVNLGRLLAKGGTASVLAGTIRHSGEINADTLGVDDTGRVVLKATDKVETTAESKTTALGGAGATGGTITVEGSKAIVSGLVDASGDSQGGTVHVLGDDVNTVGATIAANAAHGAGGEVRVGGDFQGGAAQTKTVIVDKVIAPKVVADRANPLQFSGGLLAGVTRRESSAQSGVAGPGHFSGGLLAGVAPPQRVAEAAAANSTATTQTTIDAPLASGLRAATTTVVDAASQITANGGGVSRGGNVVIWSDQHTDFRGLAAARAGDLGGNGGLVEVSGKIALEFGGTADVGAPRGHAGTLLLDPRSIRIIHGTSPEELQNPQAFADDHFGSSFRVEDNIGGGRIVVTVQDADAPGLTDTGKISVFDFAGNELGTLTGNAANEKLGAFGLNFVSTNTRLLRSPTASNGGFANAGALILFDLLSGKEVGRTSGSSADERFASLFPNQIGKNFIVQSPNADVGGVVDAGAVVTISNTTGLEVGRVSGTSLNEHFGQLANFFATAPGTFIVPSPSANNNAGTVVLASNVTGTELGRVSGVAPGDQFGSNIELFRFPGKYLIRAATADVGGVVDAGTVVLVNNSTGSEIGRVSGATTNAQFGSLIDFGATAPNTFVIRAPNSNNGAGAVVLASGVIGTELGRVSGTNPGDQFGADCPFSTCSNFVPGVQYFATGPNTYLIRAPLANGGAGAVVLASSTTGTEIGGTGAGRVVGSGANAHFGEIVDFDSRISGKYLIRSSNADVNSLMGNGTAVLVDNTTGLELGHTSGLISGDHLGTLAPTFRTNGNYFLANPNATIGPNSNAGTLILVNGTDGTPNSSIDGNSANEFLGSNLRANDGTFNNLSGGNLVLTSTGHTNPSGNVPQAGGIFGVADAGTILRGQTLGTSAQEFLGNNGFTPINGVANLVVRSPNASTNSLTNNGSVLLLDPVTANMVSPGSHVDGRSSNEFFGQQGIILKSGNYFVPSPLFTTSLGATNAGSVTLVSGTTGVEIGHEDGNVANEFFGNEINSTDLTNGDILVIARGGNGRITQLDPTSAGPTITRGSGISNNIALNGFDNVTVTFLRNVGGTSSNYVVAAPHGNPDSSNGVGFVDVVDVTTGNAVTSVSGNTLNENLGSTIDFFGQNSNLRPLGANLFAVRSPGESAGQGAVFFIDGSRATGGLLQTIAGINPDSVATGDRFGSDPLIRMSNGNVLLPVPSAKVGNLDDAGTVLTLNPTDGRGPFFELNRVDGISAGEQLGQSGQIDLTSLCCNGEFLIHSFDRSIANPGDHEGAVLLVRGDGLLEGAISGLKQNDHLGETGTAQLLGNGNFLLFNPSADNPAGPVTNTGAVILVDRANFREKGGAGAGRFYGQFANEALGSHIFPTFPFNKTAREALLSGNYFLSSPFAGPNNSQGAIYLASGVTGHMIGAVNGTAVAEGFGSTNSSIDTDIGGIQTLPVEDLLVYSPDSSAGGFSNSGTVVQISSTDLGGGNIVRGRINGGSANEFLGSSHAESSSDGSHYFVRSPFADPNGVDSGSLYFVDTSSATLTNRVDGIAAGDQLGDSSFGNNIFQFGSNLFVSSRFADVGGVVDTGRILLLDGSGNMLGRVDGNTANEQLGVRIQNIGNDIWAFSPRHNNTAGAIFAIANHDLGGGNIVRNSLLGGTAGDFLGSLDANQITFGKSPTKFFVRVPSATVNGIAAAGTAILVDDTLTEIGRTNGTSLNENFSSQFFQALSGTDNFAFISSRADTNGFVDNGTAKVVSGLTGTLVGETSGTSNNEKLGEFGEGGISLELDGSFVLVSPNADANGLSAAGAVVQISSVTGHELQRVVGISQGEHLGQEFFNQRTLPDGRLIFASSNADINGVKAAGRLVFLDPNKTFDLSKGIAFGDAGGSGDLLLTDGQLQKILDSGANLVLQAHSDIVFDPGATLNSPNGNLTLDAGGGLSLVQSVSLNSLTLISGETNGVDALIRGTVLTDIVLDSISITTKGAFSATANGGNVLLSNAQISSGSVNLHSTGLNAKGGEGSVSLVDSSLQSTGQVDINATQGNVSITRSSVSGQTVNLTATGSNIGLLQSSVVGSNALNIKADATVTADSSTLGGGDVKVNAQTLALTGAKVFGSPVTDTQVNDFFNQLGAGGAGVPVGLWSVIGATRSLSIKVAQLQLVGGAADQAFSSLVSFGGFDITASNILLEAGTGVNADATLLSLGGEQPALKFDQCIGCGDPFVTDPRVDPKSQAGIFVAGILAEPSTPSILSMLDRADDNGKGDDKKKKDKKNAKECGI